MFILFIMPGTIVKDALLQGNANISGSVNVAPGTRVSGLNKKHVGLGDVDNTSDYLKPMSAYTKQYVDTKASGTSTTGNAATATKLATARNIGGVSFDGTADISLPGVNAAGNQDTTGNAATVTNGVYTSGAQTIAGIKTFSNATVFNNGATFNGASIVSFSQAFPQGPTGTDPAQLADLTTKKYTDNTYAPKASPTLSNPTFTGTVTIPDNTLTIAKTNGLQTALDAKAPLASPTLTNPTFTGTVTIPDNALTIAKTNGLQTALDAKAPLASPTLTNPTFTGTVTIPDNALTIAKTNGLQTALDAKAPVTAPAFKGVVEFYKTTPAAGGTFYDNTANFNMPLYIRDSLYYNMGSNITSNISLTGELAQIYLIDDSVGQIIITLPNPGASTRLYTGSIVHFRRYTGTSNPVKVKVGTGTGTGSYLIYLSGSVTGTDTTSNPATMLTTTQFSTSFMCGVNHWFQMQTM